MNICCDKKEIEKLIDNELIVGKNEIIITFDLYKFSSFFKNIFFVKIPIYVSKDKSLTGIMTTDDSDIELIIKSDNILDRNNFKSDSALSEFKEYFFKKTQSECSEENIKNYLNLKFNRILIKFLKNKNIINKYYDDNITTLEEEEINQVKFLKFDDDNIIKEINISVKKINKNSSDINIEIVDSPELLELSKEDNIVFLKNKSQQLALTNDGLYTKNVKINSFLNDKLFKENTSNESIIIYNDFILKKIAPFKIVDNIYKLKGGYCLFENILYKLMDVKDFRYYKFNELIKLKDDNSLYNKVDLNYREDKNLHLKEIKNSFLLFNGDYYISPKKLYLDDNFDIYVHSNEIDTNLFSTLSLLENLDKYTHLLIKNDFYFKISNKKDIVFFVKKFHTSSTSAYDLRICIDLNGEKQGFSSLKEFKEANKRFSSYVLNFEDDIDL